MNAMSPNTAITSNAMISPYFISSIIDKKVNETMKLPNQFEEVAIAFPTPLIYRGYTSAVIAEGVPPIPIAKAIMNQIRQTKAPYYPTCLQ